MERTNFVRSGSTVSTSTMLQIVSFGALHGFHSHQYSVQKAVLLEPRESKLA
jgi:hypothetical protein